ncbi:unnamed protein product [Staurois parvus]|uniref:Uncharacterized protein n=1 Tax=Staurois parvus TaxID=386267 RepID=A0ABN9EID3_9NEOB|nr:unnamed protein product [Staurois parvus]
MSMLTEERPVLFTHRSLPCQLCMAIVGSCTLCTAIQSSVLTVNHTDTAQ